MAYGTCIPDLMIDGRPAPYGVVNERAIRATAGIMFLIGIITFYLVVGLQMRAALYVTVPLFWLDFLLKVWKGPQWSIFGIFGRYLVRTQKPEWVGAVQKRFAWSIGLFLASSMMVVSLGLGIRGWLPLAICGTCLFFMWLESAVGICAGCVIYKYLLKAGIFPDPEHRPACPGGSCSIA